MATQKNDQKKISIQKLLIFGVYALTATMSSYAEVKWKALEDNDIDVFISGKFKPEMFWAKNYSLLNSNNPFDRVVYVRHTLDYSAFFDQGLRKYEFSPISGKMTVRNKAVWGDPTSLVPTTKTSLKLVNAVFGDHSHVTPRNFFWIRELWLRMTLGHPIGLDFANRHELTLGAFSFELGRGIALGDAYAVGPDYLGFYDDGLVDQYAYGFNLSGDIIKDSLKYDLYLALLQNKSASLSQTGAKIYSQAYGRRNCPQRGFGSINWLVAGRLQWQAWSYTDGRGTLNLEPYWLYNQDPEQKIEFPSDSSSQLGTLGTAGEWKGKRAEVGFDCAFNVGNQCVRGWDRNMITMQNRNGVLTYVNSHVLLNVDPLGDNVPKKLSSYLAPEGVITVAPGTTAGAGGQPNSVGSDAQKIINGSMQSQEFNGKKIGNVSGLTATCPATGADCPAGVFTVAPGLPIPAQTGVTLDDLFNAKDRFRDPYINLYRGWMFVTDASYWVYKKDLKIAAAFGIASGDQDPNFDEVDGLYTGFIPVQESYAGKRVKSAFLMGGAGKLPRPLADPSFEVNESTDEFSTMLNGFTNLINLGAGFTWAPQDWDKKFNLNPNIIAYWTYVPTNKFDLTRINPVTGMIGEQNTLASRYLGLEMNIFTYYYLLENLKWYFTGSVFLPGTQFCDIRGKPLNSEQDKLLDQFDVTDYAGDPLPNIGTDPAVTMLMGFEYLF